MGCLIERNTGWRPQLLGQPACDITIRLSDELDLVRDSLREISQICKSGAIDPRMYDQVADIETSLGSFREDFHDQFVSLHDRLGRVLDDQPADVDPLPDA